MDNKPICPVCGREMEFHKSRICWRCEYDTDDHLFEGPFRDTDGSETRAVIAAMQQAWHDGHPHTHPLDADPESHLGVEPVKYGPMPDHVNRLAGLSTSDPVERFCGKHTLDFALARLDALEKKIAELKKGRTA